MFSQQVTNYDQDLGVSMTSSMQMNWLLRSEAYAWYFLPPITSIFILWWYAPSSRCCSLVINSLLHCILSVGSMHPVWFVLVLLDMCFELPRL